VLISAADMGALASRKPAAVEKGMANNMESLAGVTPQSMANEIIANGSHWAFTTAYAGLASTPLLVVTSNDGFAPSNDSLVVALRRLGNRRVASVHFPTDHSYSDQRIALESAVLRWLEALPH
jgi:hypothetical protein